MNEINHITKKSDDNHDTLIIANKIKVSVIVPVYKDEKYIERCLYSLINQSLKEIELIFIDDCGGDKSISIVEKNAVYDNRIKIIYNEKNVGAGLSRNKGIEIAQGEYLGFVDADDEIDLNFYEKLYTLAVKYDSDVSKGQRINYLFDGTKQNGPLTKKLSKFGEYAERTDWFFYFSCEHATAIYRNDLIKRENIRYSNTRVGEDTMFLLKMMYYAHKVSFCGDTYYYYHIRKNSLTTTNSEFFWEAKIKNFEERVLFLCSHPTEKSIAVQYVQSLANHLLVIYQSLLDNLSADTDVDKTTTIQYKYLCGIENALNQFIYKDEISETISKIIEYKRLILLK